MASAVELERLIVRLIGDGSQYDSVLKQSADATKLLGDEMRRLGGTEKEFERITASAAGVVKQAEVALGGYRFEQRRLQGLLDAGRISQDSYNRQLEKAKGSLGGATQALDGHNRMILQGIQLTKNSENATEKYNRKIAELQGLLAASAISQSTFNRHVRQAATDLGASFRDMGSSIRSFGMSWSLYVTAPIMGLLTASGIAGVQMDTLRRSLLSVAGSTREMNTQMERLREVAKLPGLGFKEAVEGSVNLQSAGFSAAMAERSLKAFGNALASVGKGKTELQMVNRALTQIMGKGKVMAQEINQVAEHLPQIRKAMMGAFDTANTEELQAMGLSSEEFITGIIQQLEKMPKMTSGIKVELENFTDAVFVAFSKVGDAINSMLGPALAMATSTINYLGTAFEGLHPWVQKTVIVVLGLVAAVGPLLIVIGTAVMLAGSLSTAYITLTTTTVGLTIAQYALAAASTAAKAGLVGLAVGAILGVSYAIYQAMPSIQKFNEELEKGRKLSETMATKERDRATAILAAAKAMEPKERKGFLEKELAGISKNVAGTTASLDRAKKVAEDLAPSWLSLGQAGKKVWQGQLEIVAEYERKLSEQSAHAVELQKELEATKVDTGPSKEALENLDKFATTLREQAATINMTTRQAKIYDLAMQGIGGTVIQTLLQQDRYLTRLEEQKKKQEDLKNKLTEFTAELHKQAATQGMTTDQVERWKLAQAGATAAQLRQVEAMQKYATALKLKEDVKELTDNLTKEIATVGMSADQIKIYELKQRGATAAVLAHVQALTQRKTALEAQNDADKLVKELQTQIQTFGLSSDEAKLYELAQKGASQQTLALARALSTQKANMEAGKKMTEKHLDPLAKYAQEYKTLRDLFAGGHIGMRTFREEVKAIDKELIDAKANAHINLVFSLEGNDAVRKGTKEFNDLLNNVGKDQLDGQLKLQMAGVRRGVHLAANVVPRLPQIPVPGLPGMPMAPNLANSPAAQPNQAAMSPQGGMLTDNVVKSLLTRIAVAVEEEADREVVILRPLGIGGSL